MISPRDEMHSFGETVLSFKEKIPDLFSKLAKQTGLIYEAGNRYSGKVGIDWVIKLRTSDSTPPISNID
jgi:hypothetical protein